LPKVLFPQGVAFEEGNYKTAETRLFFKLLQESEGKKLVWRPYRESNPVSPFLRICANHYGNRMNKGLNRCLKRKVRGA
jgi:hypothetical protein